MQDDASDDGESLKMMQPILFQSLTDEFRHVTLSVTEAELAAVVTMVQT